MKSLFASLALFISCLAVKAQLPPTNRPTPVTIQLAANTNGVVVQPTNNPITFPGGLTVQGLITGNGGGLTNLNISSTGFAVLTLSNFFSAVNNFSSAVILTNVASILAGNGSAITALVPANISAGTAAINISGNASTATTAIGFSGSLSGDVTGIQNTSVVSFVGGQPSTSIAAGSVLANAATDADTANAIVKRDASGNFSAGNITANLTGTASLATTAVNFSGSLVGDVTGFQGTTVVSYVGGQTSVAVASAATSVAVATSANTGGTLVKRDSSGNFSAGNVTATEFFGSGAGLTGLSIPSVNPAVLSGITGNIIQGFGTSNSTPATQPSSIIYQDSPAIGLWGNTWALSGVSEPSGFLMKYAGAINSPYPTYPRYTYGYWQLWSSVFNAGGVLQTNLVMSVDTEGNITNFGNHFVTGNQNVNGSSSMVGIVNTGTATNTGGLGTASWLYAAGPATNAGGLTVNGITNISDLTSGIVSFTNRVTGTGMTFHQNTIAYSGTYMIGYSNSLPIFVIGTNGVVTLSGITNTGSSTNASLGVSGTLYAAGPATNAGGLTVAGITNTGVLTNVGPAGFSSSVYVAGLLTNAATFYGNAGAILAGLTNNGPFTNNSSSASGLSGPLYVAGPATNAGGLTVAGITNTGPINTTNNAGAGVRIMPPGTGNASEVWSNGVLVASVGTNGGAYFSQPVTNIGTAYFGSISPITINSSASQINVVNTTVGNNSIRFNSTAYLLYSSIHGANAMVVGDSLGNNGWLGSSNIVAAGTITATNGFIGSGSAITNPIVATSISSSLAAQSETVIVTATGTIQTLPTAVGCPGRIYTIKFTASGTLTIATTSSQNIDAATTKTLSTQYDCVDVISDGAQWWLIREYGTGLTL